MNQRLMNIAEKTCDLLFETWVFHPQLKWDAPKVIAHRGAWDRIGCVENTMMAFEKARLIGTYGIEFDVHFTKDDVPVVHHDPTLSRICKHPGVLKEMTLKEVRAVTDEVATLEEVLALDGLHFMIEIKCPLSPGQVGILNHCLAGREPVRDYHLLAIDPSLVRESSGLPAASWVLVGELSLRSHVDLAIERKYAGVAGHYLGMSGKHISRLHEAGLKAGSGFIPSRNLFNREWRRKIDWVFTNSTSRLF